MAKQTLLPSFVSLYPYKLNIHQPPRSSFAATRKKRRVKNRSNFVPSPPFNWIELNVNSLYGLVTSSSPKAALKSPNHSTWADSSCWGRCLNLLWGKGRKGVIIQKYQHHGWKIWSSLSHANFQQPAFIIADRAQASLLKCPKACR